MTTTRASDRRCVTTIGTYRLLFLKDLIPIFSTKKLPTPVQNSLPNNPIYSIMLKEEDKLEPSSSSTTLSPGRVGWGRGDVLNSTDPHTGTGEGSESGLSSWTGLLGSGTTSSPELDVKSGDSDFLALSSDILSGQHGGVRLYVSLQSRFRGYWEAYRRLVSVGLDLHTTGNSGDGLLSRKIGNVNESVVEPID